MKHYLLAILLFIFCSVSYANPLFYRGIDHVDYYDQTGDYVCFNNNGGKVSLESKGVVYDYSGKKIGTYSSKTREMFIDRAYYNNSGKYLGKSRLLFSNAKLETKLVYYNSDNRILASYTFKLTVGSVVDFFLEGGYMRLSRNPNN